MDKVGDQPDDDERAPAIRRHSELAASCAAFSRGISEVLKRRERK